MQGSYRLWTIGHSPTAKQTGKAEESMLTAERILKLTLTKVAQ
jgi:hypothetical protein